MQTFDASLNLYRKTVKRFRPAHVAVHRLMSSFVIPIMQHRQGFHTMPDDPLWFRVELLTGQHETETVSQVERLAQPGMTVLDIGAHVGYYARRLAHLVGDTGKVYAFEPHPRTFATLQRNVHHLGNVMPVQLALAETVGTAELYDYLMMSASGSLHYDESMRDFQRAQVTDTDIAPRIEEDFPVETFTVETKPVDVFLAEQGVDKVDLVKMDIEGAEIGALRGMTRTIERSPQLRVIMEYNPHALHAFGFDPQTTLDELQRLGFSRICIIQPTGQLDDISTQSAALEMLTTQLMSNMGVVNLLISRQ